MAGTEVEHKVVDTGWKREPADAPSARFGWHGNPRKTYYIAAGFVIFALFGLMIGNHDGQVENLYLLGFAIMLVVLVVRASILNRNKWS